MSQTHPTIAASTQPAAQTDALNTAGTARREQRAFPFESSYLDIYELEEYLDGLPNFDYDLDQGADRIILFANRDLTEEEAKKVEGFSQRVYS